MSKIYFIIAFIFFLSLTAAAQVKTLSNRQLVEISKVGLSKQIILTKIAKSETKFDVSTEALIELKTAGVGEEIIAAMLEKVETNKLS